MLEDVGSAAGRVRPGGERDASAPPAPKKRKQRLYTLDAMRGVAALTVVARHFGQIFGVWEPESYIAVDLFFVLSGVVLAYNYDPQFERGLSSLSFMAARAIRLFPFALAGALLGYLSQVLAAPTHLDAGQSVLSLVLTALALPTPPVAAPLILFPFNTAFWSLFFELWVANVLFGLLWRRLHGVALGALILAGALVFVLFERHAHNVDIGWSWADSVAGAARVIFGFFIGVAISRVRSLEKFNVKAPAWACLAVLLAILLFPVSGQIGTLFRLASVLLFFPALVFVSVEPGGVNPRLATLLGDTSYGLYAIHYPILIILNWALATYVGRVSDLGTLRIVVVEATAVAGLCALTLVLDARYDRPFRSALSSWRKRRFLVAKAA